MEEILKQLNKNYGNWFKETKETPQFTNKLYPYEKMFSPIKVNKLTLKNRLVMGPMGNISMCEETGRPNNKMIAYFEERAKGGVGLITTGLVPATYGIDPSIIEPGQLSYFPRIDRSRTVLAGWRDLSGAVHSHGAHIFIQLTAGLGRVGNPQCLINSLKLPVSASWNPNFYIPQIPCKRLSDIKIKKIIKKMGQASADAKACNIDGVYLHGHEGYLIEQLTNPAFNRRKIGSFANWQNFGVKLVEEIRKRVGKDYPIMYRIDLSLCLNATYGEKMKTIKSLKKFRKERRIEESLIYMKNLVKAGVDMFDVDLGCYDNWWLPHPPEGMPSGCFLEISKLVKNYFKENKILSNAGQEVPIVGVGKLGYPDLAEQSLKDEKCDMIMLARPLLADPYWPNKVYSNKVKDIIPCIACQEACIREFVEGGHPQCAVNPITAFEDEFKQIVPVLKPKKIAVVGAGPAGVVTCQVLVNKGHNVTLYEKENEVGGVLKYASVPKIKYELENYRQYLIREVNKMQKMDNFKLVLNREVTIKELKKENFDCIVCCTGAKQSNIQIEGISNPNVFNVIDILKNPLLVKNAKNISIIGGGDAGCEMAYYLACELDKNVTIIEATSTLMTHTCTANRGYLLHYLEHKGVQIHNCSTVKFVNKDNSITVLKNISDTVPNPFNTWQPVLPENIKNPLAKKIKTELQDVKIPADVVITAFGVASNNEIYFECVANNIAKEIYNVGDSFLPGKVFGAVKSAYRKALSI